MGSLMIKELENTNCTKVKYREIFLRPPDDTNTSYSEEKKWSLRVVSEYT